MTQIATDLNVTRERAKLLRFEPSAAIPQTNVQDAIAAIGSGFLPNLTTPTVVTATGAIATSSVVVQTNQAAPITLTVPDSVAWAAANSKYGLPLSIFDISGAASTNNVTLNFTSGQTVDGLSSLTISTDFGGFRLEPKSGGGWIIV